MRDLVRLLQVLADETRLRLLLTLLDDEATVSELAARLALPQPRISTHLAHLRDAGLVTTQPQGRQRMYRVDAQQLGPVLAALQTLTPSIEHPPLTEDDAGLLDPSRLSADATRLVRRNAPIRQARTCYDHLAGSAGVSLLNHMLQRGWLKKTGDGRKRQEYQLTEAGMLALEDRGVDVQGAERARRLFAYGCLDWTERQYHLGGALGSAILDAMLVEGFARREDGRIVTLRESVERWLA